MAIDEVLLHAVGLGLAAPTLRLYRWQQATLSLGYFQGISGLADQTLIVQSMPLVRRMTGGGAIIHDRELTYCLALPLHDCPASLADALGLGGKPIDMYSRMHAFIAQAVERLGRQGQAQAEERSAGAPSHSGAFLCFERHSKLDLMMAGDKLAGSAQRRTKQAVIQHGSIVLHPHASQPSQAVERITGRRITFEEMASELLNALRSAGLELANGQLSHDESTLLPALLEKHKSRQWLSRVV
jgi:lipoate-protein ligase A